MGRVSVYARIRPGADDCLAADGPTTVKMDGREGAQKRAWERKVLNNLWERGPTRRVLNQSYALPSRACMYNLEVRLLNRESPLIMPRELPADVT